MKPPFVAVLTLVLLLLVSLFVVGCTKTYDITYTDTTNCGETCQAHLTDKICSRYNNLVDIHNKSNCLCEYKGCSNFG